MTAQTIDLMAYRATGRILAPVIATPEAPPVAIGCQVHAWFARALRWDYGHIVDWRFDRSGKATAALVQFKTYRAFIDAENLRWGAT